MAKRPRAADEDHKCLPNVGPYYILPSASAPTIFLPRASRASQQLLATGRNLVLAR